MGLGRVFFEPSCPWLVLPLTFHASKCPVLLNMSLVFAVGSSRCQFAPRLFPVRGASASEFKCAGFGGPGFGTAPVSLAVSRDSSWEVWGHAPLTSPPFFPFQLFELSSSCSKEENPLCLLPHLPAFSPDAAILLYWAAPALGETSAWNEIH